MSLEGGGAARGGRLATAATFAWSWALPLLVVSVALKVAWVAVCVADGSLTLSPWEWLLLPLVATPQHLLAAAFFLGLYLVLGLAGSLCRPARVASTVLACGVQGFMVYFYMVAFRMAQVMGSLPTAELLGAAFQGDVAASTLFSRENIPYEIVAAVLIAAALLVPRHLARRYPGWPRQRVVVGTAVATGAWCTSCSPTTWPTPTRTPPSIWSASSKGRGASAPGSFRGARRPGTGPSSCTAIPCPSGRDTSRRTSTRSGART